MLQTQLNEYLKEALRARNQRAVSTLRLILAALKDRNISAREEGKTDGITETEILAMLHTMIKQRRVAISLLEQDGRQELAEQKAEEIRIIESFMPRPFDEHETKLAVEAVINEISAASIRDTGRTMTELRRRYAEQIDLMMVSVLVKQALGCSPPRLPTENINAQIACSENI